MEQYTLNVMQSYGNTMENEVKLTPPLFKAGSTVYKFETSFIAGGRREVLRLVKRTKDNRMRIKSPGNMAFTPKELKYAVDLLI